MASHNFVVEFEQLAATFPCDLKTAGELDTPNSEDDLFARVVTVGFSYTASTEEWGRNHLQFIRDRLDGDLASETRTARLFASVSPPARIDRSVAAMSTRV